MFNLDLHVNNLIYVQLLCIRHIHEYALGEIAVNNQEEFSPGILNFRLYIEVMKVIMTCQTGG